MAKMRVYEVAKHLGIPTKELLLTLQQLGMEVQNSFNVVDANLVYRLIAEAAPKIAGKAGDAAGKAAKANATPPPPPKVIKKASDKPVAPPPPPPPKVHKAPTDAKARAQAKAEAEERTRSEAEAREKARAEKRAREEARRKPPTPVKAKPAADRPKAPPPPPPPVKKQARTQSTPPPQKRRGAPAAPPPPPPDEGKKDRSPRAKDARKKKGKDADGKPVDTSKRYDAIKQKGMQKQRQGQKTTFLKKRTGKKKKDGAKTETPPPPAAKKSIIVTGPLTVKELAHEAGLKSSDIIMHLMKELNLMAPLNHSLDVDVIQLVCESFNIEVLIKKTADQDIPEEVAAAAANEDMETRPPVVTIMGHVDHGKTRLLDTIRHTNVIDTESGGITQHIGAYQITHQDRKITFLDTPGHESFTALRARGAKVTDIAVLVVAADDGVMPQTIEAIDHARDAGVPILVAINKIDKDSARPDRIKQQLAEKELIAEDWGGETVMVPISAKFNQNIEDLLDMIFLVADMQEPMANPKRKAVGTVIEAEMDKGKGPTASVLVQDGTLYVGDYIVAGLCSGRVRAMESDRGERLPMAGPSMPVKLVGLDAVPEAGDKIFVLEDEKTIKEIVNKRRLKDREEKLRYESRVSLEDLFNRIQEGKINEFKVIIKGDVQGSIEAIVQALQEIKHEEVRVNVIRSGVGEVKETDVMLAAAAGAVIFTFHTGVNPAAHAMAQHERVDVRHYDVIYRLIDDVKMAMAGMLAPEYEEEYAGRVEVRKIFESSKVGKIAGCYVEDGEIKSGAIARLMRDGEEIYKGKIATLKRFKDNVKTVAQGYECGIVLDNYSDLHEEDRIETYTLIEKKRETI